MKKCFYLSLYLGLVLIFVSCAAVNEKTLKESGAKLLNQQDLMEFFKVERVGTGRTIQGPFKIYYFPDRTQILEHRGGGDQGKYRIGKWEGMFCSKWMKIRSGAEKCNRLYRTGENKIVYVNQNGSFDTEMTFKK